MRILVYGGRYFKDVPKLWATLDNLDKQHNIRVIIDGASDDVTGPYLGADYWAHQWAIARNKTTERFHADWKTHGKAAGPIRNKIMRDMGNLDGAVAFKGNRGTANMTSLLDEHKIGIVFVE